MRQARDCLSLYFSKKARKGIPMYPLIVGIDIAAESAACYWQNPRGEASYLEIAQTEKGFQTLSQKLQKLTAAQNTLLVMEATGTYWLTLALYFHQAGFAISVLNPSDFHHFARSGGQRAKTDKEDARLLADYGQIKPPKLWSPPPNICFALQQRLSLRDDFQQDKVRNSNRLHALKQNPLAEAEVLARLEAQIDSLASQVKALENEIRALLASEHEWSQAAQRLLSITGIGLLTTAWLLTATHNFARCANPEQAAAFAGLAPYANDSGKHKGKRFTRSGHAQLRKMLYMAAGAALRYNPPLRQFYQKLVQRGKIKQVARVAVARKLIHLAWACVSKDRDFDPNFRQNPVAA
jgi:transposase